MLSGQAFRVQTPLRGSHAPGGWHSLTRSLLDRALRVIRPAIL